MIRNYRWCWMLIAAALVNGCASSEKKPETAQAGGQEQAIGQNVLVELDTLEEELERQRSLDAALLAPEPFAAAEKEIREARKVVASRGSLSDLNGTVDAARAHLNQVRSQGAGLRGPFSASLRARNDAIIAGAAGSKSFVEADKDFREVTSSIDTSKMDHSEIGMENARIESSYRSIELAAIQNRYLSDARQLLARAEQKKAGELVPGTYEESVASLRDAERYIQHNPYDAKENGRRASEVAFDMRRLNALTDRANWIKTQAPEDVALWMESQANEIRGELGLGDLRDRNLTEQFDVIAAGVSSMDFTNQQLSNQNEEMRSRLGRQGGEPKQPAPPTESE